MTAVRSMKNQYRGVNAHLHSHWQSRSGWHEFHTSYIRDMLGALRSLLLPMGYTAGMEQSVQIRRIEDDEPIGRPKSDITFYDPFPSSSRRELPSVQPGSPVMLRVPEMIEILEEEIAPYRAIAIRKLDEPDPGKPIVWIELLSPSNKPGGQDARLYRDKRLQVLQSNMVFIELDFLHETAPTFGGVGDYTRNQSGSHPYRIALIDPHPAVLEGKGFAYEFDVDDPIPTVQIPLSGDDKLEFNFGIPYNKTLEELLYTYQLVDYSQLPLKFDRYNEADQTRIANRMLAVLRASVEGKDLEATMLSIEMLPMEDALAQIQTL